MHDGQRGCKIPRAIPPARGRQRSNNFERRLPLPVDRTVLERYEHITRRLSTEISDCFNTIARNPKHDAGAQPRCRLVWDGPPAGVSEAHFYFCLIHRYDKMVKIWNSGELSLRLQCSEKYGHFLASKIWLSRH